MASESRQYEEKVESFHALHEMISDFVDSRSQINRTTVYWLKSITYRKEVKKRQRDQFNWKKYHLKKTQEQSNNEQFSIEPLWTNQRVIASLLFGDLKIGKRYTGRGSDRTRQKKQTTAARLEQERVAYEDGWL